MQKCMNARTHECLTAISFLHFCIPAFAHDLFVRKHPRELRRVDLGDEGRPAQAALLPPRLAAQNVLFERLATQKLPGLGPLEAFGRSAVCLEFGHDTWFLRAE
jgi:hypothetical protein